MQKYNFCTPPENSAEIQHSEVSAATAVLFFLHPSPILILLKIQGISQPDCLYCSNVIPQI